MSKKEGVFKVRIKELRQKMNLTQEELGAKIGQTKSNISKYERGMLEPGIETLKLLADIFDVSIDYLVGNTTIRENHGHDPVDHGHELLKNIDNLSEESKKELVNYIRLLKIKDDMDRGKEEQSSALEKKA